jgi:hypothetical protein
MACGGNKKEVPKGKSKSMPKPDSKKPKKK